MASRIRALFWNRDEDRLRALWRLLLHALSLAVIGIMAALVLNPVADLIGQVPADVGELVEFGVITLVVVLATWLVGHTLDRRHFADFGLRLSPLWWTDFGAGAALGALLMGGIFGLELAAGWVTIEGRFSGAPEGQPFVIAIAVPLMMFAFVGFYEELLSRGYHLRNLAEGLRGKMIGPKLALVLAAILSAAVFGLLHADNPGATTQSTINVGVAGLMLSVAPLLTGELGFAIGLHLSWNFFQGNVFGFPVSGTDAGPRVLALQQGGDPLITGGEFGPEAGLVGLGAMVVGSLATLAWIRVSRGHPISILSELGGGPRPPKLDAAR